MAAGFGTAGPIVSSATGKQRKMPACVYSFHSIFVSHPTGRTVLATLRVGCLTSVNPT